jgi:hypothetical protein
MKTIDESSYKLIYGADFSFKIREKETVGEASRQPVQKWNSRTAFLVEVLGINKFLSGFLPSFYS